MQDPVKLQVQDFLKIMEHLILPHLRDILVVLSHCLPILQVAGVAGILLENQQVMGVSAEFLRF